jgi:hypothetical protein
MKKPTKICIAAVAALGLAVAPAAAAFAAPWDGSNFPFQNGKWAVTSDSFGFDDVYLISPANSSSPTVDISTDIWDMAGELNISLDDWLSEESVGAASDADVDVSDDAATGDKVLSAAMTSTGDPWEGQLDITGEMRIFAAGDLVRTTFFITNTTASPVTASFRFDTNFGSSGDLFSYQGQDDSILPVPAAENSTSADALNASNVQWAVHTEDEDAPGAVAWGLKTAEKPGVLELDGDDYNAYYDDVVIPAGATIALAEFHNWTPALLLSEGYLEENGDPVKQALFAAAATTAAAEFDSFSGRLINGLAGYNVINWGQVPASEPALPDTGLGVEATVGLGGVALLLLGAGAASLVIRRRA